MVDGHSKNGNFAFDSYCDTYLLTLKPNVISRVQLGLEREKIHVAVNGKLACSNIPREDRKAFKNVQVWLSDPWHRPAKAIVNNLYFREGHLDVICNDVDVKAVLGNLTRNQRELLGPLRNGDYTQIADCETLVSKTGCVLETFNLCPRTCKAGCAQGSHLATNPPFG